MHHLYLSKQIYEKRNELLQYCIAENKSTYSSNYDSLSNISLMTLSKFMYEHPAGLVSSSAFFFNSIVLCLIFFPLSPTISSLISFSTSSLFTLVSISIPISHSLQIHLQFVGWSAKNGQHNIGTPAEMLSMVEL